MANSNGAGELTKFSRAQETSLLLEERRVKRNRRMREWVRRNRKSVNATMQDWKKRNCDAVNAIESRYRTRRYQQDPNYYKEINLRDTLKKFGLTVENYEQILERQGGVCAICQQPELVNSRLCIDHNHKTGKSRGLLCGPCNKRLSAFEDELWTEKALSYLEEHK